jgi:predicted transposase YbfD/YdcC
LSKKTFADIKKSGNDAIIQLKNNQPNLYKMLSRITSQPPIDIDTTTEKNHSRIETRSIKTFHLPQYNYFDFKTNYVWARWNNYISAVIHVERIIEQYNHEHKRWRTTKESSIYLATYIDTALGYAEKIRKHWLIENSNNYVRDQALNEDASRIRKNPHAFAILRSFVLNILRYNKETNIRTTLYKNCCDLDRLLKYKALF